MLKAASLGWQKENHTHNHRKPATAYIAPVTLRSHWKVWLVAADCMLIGIQPILIHLSKNASSGYSYHPVSVTISVEAVKTVMAAAMLVIFEKGNKRVDKSGSLLLRQYQRHGVLLLPAGLYAINGYLKFMMLLYFAPTTAKMLGNLKVLVIALLMKILLRRTFSILQWEALLLLCVGVTINHLQYCSEGSSAIQWAAIWCTAASLLVPSSASIFNEWALKRDKETSIFVQNFILYLFGLVLNSVGLLAVSLQRGQSISTLFGGQNQYTFLLILVTAIQGSLASVFYKFADTLLKKYSSTLATIFTALLSAALLGHHLTFNFLLAVVTISCSMHIFFGEGSLRAAPVSRLEGSNRKEHKGQEEHHMQDVLDPESLTLLANHKYYESQLKL